MVTISGETRVAGLFGHPVRHSLSPDLHNAAYRALGLDYCYAAFDVVERELAGAVRAVTSLGMAGVNVTAPHKEGVIPYLDKLSPDASFLKAVNTIVNEDGLLTGYNTDAKGYLEGLYHVLGHEEVKMGSALLLGGGGAARAAAMALAQGGLGRLLVALRSPDKIQGWLADFKKRYPEVAAKALYLGGDEFMDSIPSSTLIINTLPNQTDENRQDWFLQILARCRTHSFFSDLRYVPRETPFLKMGMSLGCRVQNGLPMLLEQAILSFSLFTGKTAPREVMKQALGL